MRSGTEEISVSHFATHIQLSDPMTKIDRYIVFEFGRVFVICFVTFMGLFIVADFVNQFDELMRQAETHDGILRVLSHYYAPKVPWFFDFIGRIISLVAAVFAVTSLQRNNEMAAMMAAGISRFRIVKPIIYGGAALAILGVLNRELLIPRLGERVYSEANNVFGENSEDVRAQYDYASEIFIDGEDLVPATQTIKNPTFHLPTKLAERGTIIAAEEAKRIPAQDGRPAGFAMLRVDLEKTGVKQSISLDGKVIIYHPNDSKWLGADQLYVVTDLPFEQLRAKSSWKQCASTWSLIQMARNPSLGTGADVSMSIHSRILQPAIDMLMLFLGLPIVLSRESRNAFIAVGSCMLVVTVFIIAVLAFHGMGSSYLMKPSLAAWLPLVIFIPISVLMSGPFRR